MREDPKIRMSACAKIGFKPVKRYDAAPAATAATPATR